VKPLKLKYTGLVNKLRQEEVPMDKCFQANNVQFSNTNELIFPRTGSEVIYSGTCTSLNVSTVGTLFVESGNLNLYDGTATPVALLSTVGSGRFAYTSPIATTVYFSNGAKTGRYIKGGVLAKEWGTPTPANNPTCTVVTYGGMFAGDYRIAITYVADEESGALNSTRVTVSEGGGIVLTNFPTPPAYVTKYAVYVSSVNGKDLYLYGEYATNTTTVTIAKSIGTIPLETQFLFPPVPPANSTILSHYGKIYYTNGSLLYYTEPQRYGLQRAHNFFPFDSDIQTVVSCPGVLYVGTSTSLYKITNIDGEGGAQLEPLQACGSVKWSECYDPDGISAFFMSHRGFIKATPEGLTELSYESVAIPFYTAGTMTVTEDDGLKYLTFIGTGGTKNPLANTQWNIDDWGETVTQASGWAINLTTGAVSKYTGYNFTVISNGYGCSADGISTLSGSTDNDVAIAASVTSGKFSFSDAYKSRVTDAYIEVDGGALTFTAETDNGSVAYKIPKTNKLETVKTNMARGAKGRLWQFTLANKTGSAAIVADTELVVEVLSRRI
jgi:hypothetical protein